jgi:VWFA-related protein
MQGWRSHGFGRSLPRVVAELEGGRKPAESRLRAGLPALLAAALILSGGWGAWAQDSGQPFQIQVETNVVMVRVVVRDAQGRPVAGLHKEDFRLFDNGKPQEITGFAVESGAGKASAPEAVAPAAPPASAPAPAAPVPQRFVALFFDDLHMDTGAVAQTRDAAWRYINTNLRPVDRVALFTSSNTSKRGIVDFTDDRAKLHEALFRLAAHSRTNPRAGQCPSIGDYQAYLISELQQTDALQIAVEEGYLCRCKGLNESSQCADTERIQAQGLAAQVWGLADRQSEDALDVMNGVVNLLAARPGQRALVLVSTGFLTATREKSIEALIDRALRQNVVVNAIDGAGLYTKEFHDPILVTRPDLDREKFRMENEGLTMQRGVLASLAQGTGGTFFHNSNDMDDGLRRAVQAPDVYYVISFSPRDVKLDGRFHPLKVTVNTGGHWDVQARRGYFADAALTDKNPTKTELAQALYSLDERQDLPATVTAQVERPSGDGPNVTVKIHVDIRAAQFRKESGRNIDTLTFDTAVFDRDGKYVAGKDSSLDFRLPDGKLERLLESGVNAQTGFRVAPGVYRIREVVRDTESNKMSALNCNVEMTTAPLETAAATELSSIVAPAAPAKPKKEKKTKSMAEWTTAELVKAMPELSGLDPTPDKVSSQDRLPILLASVGQNVKLFFETLPDTSAHERIDLDRLDWSEHYKEEFNYLDLPRPGAKGVGLEEFRTNASGNRAEPLALEHGFVTKGFASMIIHFHPLYQAESAFRYLGAQTMDKRATDVVYFMQIPGKARAKQSLKTDIRSLEILIQGVAWIDTANSQIVRMRTELLTPQGDPDLRLETTESRFTAVQFKGATQAFWLPEEVTVTLNWQGMLFRNRHRYSDFQLFRVDASPAAPPPAASK